MKQWKVLLAAVLVCAALFAGCSNKKEPVAANPNPETIPTQAQPQEEKEPETQAPAEDQKAGLVEKAQEDKDAVLAAF